MNSKISILEAGNKTLQSQVDDLQNKLSQPSVSQAGNSDTRKELDQAKNTIEDLVFDNRKLSDDLKAKTLELQAANNQKNQEINSVQNPPSQKNTPDNSTRIQELEKQVQDLLNKIQNLTAQLEDSTKKYNRLKMTRSQSITISQPAPDLRALKNIEVLDSLKRFDQIKRLIEAKSPQNPPAVDTMRTEKGDYIIQVQYPPQDIQTPAVKKRITIPEHLFTEMKGVIVESNVDPATGATQNDKIFRQSFADGQKTVEAIAAKEVQTGPSMISADVIQLDVESFRFFGIPVDSEVKEDVPAFVLSKTQEQDLGEDFGLVKFLISPSFASEQLEGTKIVLKREAFRDGQKEGEGITVIPMETIKQSQEKEEESLINSLLSEIEKNDREAADFRSPSNQKPRPDFMYRKSEDPNSGMKVLEKIQVPVSNPADPDILKRVVIESVESGSAPAKDEVKALVKIESFEGMSKRVDYMKFEKNRQGQSMTRRPSPERTDSGQKSPKLSPKPIKRRSGDDKLTQELAVLNLLARDPAFMEAKTETSIAKIWTDPQGNVRVELVDREPGSKNHTMLERIQVSPAELDVKEEQVSFKREKVTDGQLIVEKVDLRPKSKPVVNLISINNLIISSINETASRHKMLGLEDQINQLSANLKKAVMLSIVNQNTPGFQVNNELSEFLYTIVPESDLASERPIFLRVYSQGQNRVFEKFEAIDEPGDRSEFSKVPRQLGLVSQRFTLLDYQKENQNWLVLRETDGQRGRADAIRFYQPKLSPQSILTRKQKPAPPEDAISERNPKETRTIRLPNGISKSCLDQFELTRQIVKSVRALINSSQKTPCVVLLTELADELLIERYSVPIPGVCYAEVIDRYRISTQDGKSCIHQTIDPSGGQVFEEYDESAGSPEKSQLVHRVIVADVEKFNRTQENVVLRDALPVEPAELYKLVESQKPRTPQPQKDQKILREKIHDNETISEEIVIPTRMSFEPFVPKCLESFALEVLERTYNAADSQPSLYPDCGLTSRILQEVGGLENLLSVLANSNTRAHRQDILTFAGVEQDGLVLERLQVTDNEGGILDNLKLLERLRVRGSRLTAKLEDISATKEVFTGPKTVISSEFRFSKSEGAALPNQGVKRVLLSSDSAPKELGRPQRSVLLKAFDSETQIGQFFRFLFDTHELLSKYVIIRCEKKGEFRKFEVEQGPEGLQGSTIEAVHMDSSKTAVMRLERLVLDAENPIREEISITSKTELSAIAPLKHLLGTDMLSKTFLKMKSKLRRTKNTLGLKVQTDKSKEDVLDCFLRRRLPADFEDIINLTFRHGHRSFAPDKRYLKFYSYTQDKCLLKIFELDPLKASRAQPKTFEAYQPVLCCIAEIEKAPGIRRFVDFFRSTMDAQQIIEQKVLNPVDAQKSEYKSIKKTVLDPARRKKKTQTFVYVSDPLLGIPSLTMAEEREETADQLLEPQTLKQLEQYASVVFALFHSPDQLFRPNCFLVEHAISDKKTVDRVDLLKLLDSDSLVPTALLREKVLVTMRLLEELGKKDSVHASIDYFKKNAPEVAEQNLSSKRSRLEDGKIINETISIGIKEEKLETALVDKQVLEPRRIDKYTAASLEKLPESVVLAIKYFQNQNTEATTALKTLVMIEPREENTLISRLAVRFEGPFADPYPLAYSINNYSLTRELRIVTDPSATKFHFLGETAESIKIVQESLSGADKLQVADKLIRPNLAEEVTGSKMVSLPPDWQTQINLPGLSKILERLRDLSKEDYFLQRREENGHVIYEVAKFTTEDPKGGFLIVESVTIEADKDPFKQAPVPQRNTFVITDDDFYKKLKLMGDGDTPTTPSKPQKPEKPGLFDSLNFNEQGLVEDIGDEEDEFGDLDNEGIIERKYPRTFGSMLEEEEAAPKTLRKIDTPIVSIIKAIDDLKLQPEEKKDTILVQRHEGDQTIVELVRVKPAAGEKTSVYSPVVRITSLKEPPLFAPIEMIREHFRQTDGKVKIIDTIKVTPEMVVEKTATKEQGFLSQSRTSGLSVADLMLHLTKYLSKLKKYPYYANVVNDSPEELAAEVVEIKDPASEIPKEKLHIKKKGKYTPEGTQFEGTRADVAGDGTQKIETINYLKKADGAAVLVKDTQIQETKPKKPYRRTEKEKRNAEEAGILPSVAVAPVTIEQILDMMVSDTDTEDPKEFLVKQKIEDGQKIIEKFEVVVEGPDKGLKLVERFMLGSTENDPPLAPAPGSAARPLLSVVSLAQYLLKPEKKPDGSVTIRVLEIVPENNNSPTRSIMMKPLTPEERKKWKIVISGVSEDKPVESVVPPSFYLEIKEVIFDKKKNTQKVESPLGDIVGYSLDGRPIFQKQLKDPTEQDNIQRNHDTNPSVSPVSPINITPQPHDERDPPRNQNMFDSVEENTPRPPLQPLPPKQEYSSAEMSPDDIESIKRLMIGNGDEDEPLIERIKSILENNKILDELAKSKFKESIVIAPLENSADLQGRIRELEAQCRDLIKQNQALSKDIDKANDEKLKLEEKADNMRREVKNLQAQLGTTPSGDNDSATLILDLRSKLASLQKKSEDEIGDLRKQNNQLVDESAELLVKAMKLEEEKKRLIDLQQELERVRNQLSKDQQKVKDLTEENDRLNKRFKAATQELEEARDDLEQAQKDKVRLMNLPKSEQAYNPDQEKIRDLEERDRQVKSNLLKAIQKMIDFKTLGEEEARGRTTEDLARSATRGINNLTEQIDELRLENSKTKSAAKGYEERQNLLLEELRHKLSEKAIEVQQLENQVNSLKRQSLQAQEEAQKLQKEIDRLKTNASADQTLKGKDAEIKQLEEQIGELRGEIKLLKDRLSEADNKLLIANQELSLARKPVSVDSAVKPDSLLNSDLDNSLQQLKDKGYAEPSSSNHDRLVAVQSDKLSDLLRSVPKLSDDLEKAQKKIQALDNELRLAGQKLADSQGKSSTERDLLNQIAELTKTVGRQDEVIKSLEGLQTLPAQIEALSQTISKLNDSDKKKDSIIKEMDKELDNKRDELKREKDRTNALELRILDITSAISSPAKPTAPPIDSDPLLDADVDRALRALLDRQLLEDRPADPRRTAVDPDKVASLARAVPQLLDDRDLRDKQLLQARDAAAADKDRAARQTDALAQDLDAARGRLLKSQEEADAARRSAADLSATVGQLTKALDELRQDKTQENLLRARDRDLADATAALDSLRDDLRKEKDRSAALDLRAIELSSALAAQPKPAPSVQPDPLLEAEVDKSLRLLDEKKLLDPAQPQSADRKASLPADKVQTLSRAVGRLLDDHERLERDLKAQREKAAENGERLTRQLEALNRDAEANRDRQNKLQSELDDTKKARNDAEFLASQLQRAIDNLKEDKTLENLIKSKDSDISSLNKDKDGLRDELKREKDRTNALELRILDITSAISSPAKPTAPPIDSDPLLDADVDRALRALLDRQLLEDRPADPRRTAVDPDKVASLARAVPQLLDDRDLRDKQLLQARDAAAADKDRAARQTDALAQDLDAARGRLLKSQEEADAARRSAADLSATVGQLTKALDELRQDKTQENLLRARDRDLADATAALDSLRDDLRKEKDRSAALDLRAIELSSALAAQPKPAPSVQPDPLLEAEVDKSLRLLDEKKLLDPAQPQSADRKASLPADKVQTLSRAVGRLLDDHERLERDLKAQREKAAENGERLTRQLEALNRDAEANRDRQNKLQSELDDTKKARNDAEFLASQLQRAIDNLKEDKTLENLIKSKDSDISSLKKGNDGLRDDLKNLKDALAQNEIRLLKATEEKEQFRLDKLKADALANQKPQEPLQEELAKANRLLEAKNQVDTFAPKKYPDSDYKQHLDNVLTAVPKLLDAFEKKSQEAKFLGQDVADLTQKLANSSAQAQRDAEAASKKLADKEEELRGLRKSKGELESEAQGLAASLQELRSNKTAESQLRQKEAELSDLKRQLEEQRTDARSLRDKANAQDLQIMGLTQDAERLRAERLKNTYPDIDPQLLAECERLIGQLTLKKLVDGSFLAQLEQTSSVVCPPKIAPGLSRGVAALLSQNDRLKEQVTDLKSDLARAGEEAARKAEQLEGRLRDEKSKSEREIEQLEREVRESRRREADLDDRLGRTVDKSVMQDKLGKLAQEAEEKKSTIAILEKEISSLKAENLAQQESAKSLESEVTEKSTRLIQLEAVKTRVQELEDEKKRTEAKNAKAVEALNEEIKSLRIEAQKQKLAAEMAQNRIRELEKQLARLQEELNEKRKAGGEAIDFNDTIKSQSNLISALKDKESRFEADARKLARDKELLENEYNELKRELDHKQKTEKEYLEQIREMYERLEELSSEVRQKEIEAIESNRETDMWKDKFNRFKSSIESEHDAEDFQQKLKQAQLENDLERYKRTEAEQLSRASDVQLELRNEKGRRKNAEHDLESAKSANNTLAVELDQFKRSNRQLEDKIAELNQKILSLKADSTLNNKLFDTEQELHHLKTENNDLSMRIKDMGDDIRMKQHRERSLSKENTELKNKMRSERMMQIKQSETAQKEQADREREQERHKRDRQTDVSPLKEGQIPLDYGPVFDLKLKNMALVQEINQLRSRLSDAELRDRRDQSMLNFLKTQEMRDLKDTRIRDISPIAHERDREDKENTLDDMDISLRASPLKPRFGEDQELLNECMRLRDELLRLTSENETLRNSVSLLKSELIVVAHNRVPPELTSPNMVMKGEYSINLSRDVVDLARTVKRETEAINELSRSIRRRDGQQSSGKKLGIPSSSLDRLQESAREKPLRKRLKEMEARIAQYEEILSDLNAKLEKKDTRVAGRDADKTDGGLHQQQRGPADAQDREPHGGEQRALEPDPAADQPAEERKKRVPLVHQQLRAAGRSHQAQRCARPDTLARGLHQLHAEQHPGLPQRQGAPAAQKVQHAGQGNRQDRRRAPRHRRPDAQRGQELRARREDAPRTGAPDDRRGERPARHGGLPVAAPRPPDDRAQSGHQCAEWPEDSHRRAPE